VNLPKSSASAEELQLRIFGDTALPALVYLPGLHGDWTLVTGFRLALASRARFVEITYPRSLEWSLADYVDAIESSLLTRGIDRGWLLAESWGSQPAWGLIERTLESKDKSAGGGRDCFGVEGLVLAAGFVKHPWEWGPTALHWIGRHTSPKWYQLELKIHGWYARTRHRHAPESLESLKEFAARRTEFDRQCMRRRLDLLAAYDPRPTAQRTHLPVHYLAGLFDPLVPWVLVRRWLRKNCPGYRGGKTFWLGDHNVLSTAPECTADLVLKWMKVESL
jgi:pimeloyl-ACP methyl ester carboxylesterase